MIALNIIFVVIGVITGIIAHSTALLADAAHNGAERVLDRVEHGATVGRGLGRHDSLASLWSWHPSLIGGSCSAKG